MTIIKVTRHNNNIVKVVCDGHTDYGEEGEDIVCAALSSVVQTAVLGLMSVAAINVDLKRDDKLGFLEFSISKDLDDTDRNNANMILETMYAGIADLHEGFSKYIKLEA